MEQATTAIMVILAAAGAMLGWTLLVIAAASGRIRRPSPSRRLTAIAALSLAIAASGILAGDAGSPPAPTTGG